MAKKNDWQSKFDEIVRKYSSLEFKAGRTDCLCFVAEAVEVSSGVDVMDGHRGDYSDLRKGYSLIKKLRGSMAGVMDEHFERVDPAFAQRGDAVLIKFTDGVGWAFGVVALDPKNILVKSEEGIKIISRQKILDLEQYYWRIECHQ